MPHPLLVFHNPGISCFLLCCVPIFVPKFPLSDSEIPLGPSTNFPPLPISLTPWELLMRGFPVVNFPMHLHSLISKIAFLCHLNRYIDFLIKILSNNELSLLQAMEDRMSKEGERGLSPMNLLMNNNNNSIHADSNSSIGSSGGGSLVAPENLSYLFSVWRMGGDYNKAKAM